MYHENPIEFMLLVYMLGVFEKAKKKYLHLFIHQVTFHINIEFYNAIKFFGYYYIIRQQHSNTSRHFKKCMLKKFSSNSKEEKKLKILQFLSNIKEKINQSCSIVNLLSRNKTFWWLFTIKKNSLGSLK
jgi:hypothetical protein